jgi:hypothetical protein
VTGLRNQSGLLNQALVGAECYIFHTVTVYTNSVYCFVGIRSSRLFI